MLKSSKNGGRWWLNQWITRNYFGGCYHSPAKVWIKQYENHTSTCILPTNRWLVSENGATQNDPAKPVGRKMRNHETLGVPSPQIRSSHWNLDTPGKTERFVRCWLVDAKMRATSTTKTIKQGYIAKKARHRNMELCHFSKFFLGNFAGSNNISNIFSTRTHIFTSEVTALRFVKTCRM